MDGTIAAWKQGHPMLWKHGPKSKAKPGQLGGRYITMCGSTDKERKGECTVIWTG